MTHIDTLALQAAGIEIAILVVLFVVFMPDTKRKKKWPPK